MMYFLLNKTELQVIEIEKAITLSISKPKETIKSVSDGI